MIDIIVIGIGLTLIAFISWFFFGPKKKYDVVIHGEGDKQAQEVTITVKGGYSPSVIRVKKDTPVSITYDRQESGDCTEYVVFDERLTSSKKQIRARLPAYQKTVVTFTPDTSGTFGFACGMGMVHGKVEVN